LIGVHPDYQNKAVTAVIFSEYHTTSSGVENCFRTPELAETTAIHNLWKHFNTEINAEEKLSG
jgi:hypothetical protein